MIYRIHECFGMGIVPAIITAAFNGDGTLQFLMFAFGFVWGGLLMPPARSL